MAFQSFRAAVVALLLLLMVAGTGCGRSATSPTPPQPSPTPPAPAPAGAPVLVTVTDGWTKSPVAGAAVSGDGVSGFTDGAGRLTVMVAPDACRSLTVTAAGFMERRTCAAASVTLWPIADAAEMAATRAAVFPNDRLAHHGVMSSAAIKLAPEVDSRPELSAVLRTAADEIRLRTAGKLSVTLTDRLFDDGYIVSLASGSPPCGRHGWFTWNFAASGFCWEPTPDYFVQNIVIDAGRIGQPGVALRALLYAFIMRQHQVAGVMNATQPGPELSEFEKKTLHMVSLRWPTEIIWPDVDGKRPQ